MAFFSNKAINQLSFPMLNNKDVIKINKDYNHRMSLFNNKRNSKKDVKMPETLKQKIRAWEQQVKSWNVTMIAYMEKAASNGTLDQDVFQNVKGKFEFE